MSRIVIGHPFAGSSETIIDRIAVAQKEGLRLVVVLPDGRPLFTRGLEEGIDEAFKLIEGDPHQWSTRPCPTCSVITRLIGRDFGCDAHRHRGRLVPP